MERARERLEAERERWREGGSSQREGKQEMEGRPAKTGRSGENYGTGNAEWEQRVVATG